ncbi:Autophagy-related protein 37 [Sphaceloma murrayae]|uniref:Autophagy-related protein 37 n=1 Tax=Sphaceloma murrayae TaxID=2082308 RepID=A0A2K1QSR8_9PEZI|nr:Autophagy-related protein 37 [Sphaceloma murrayae]
MNSSSYDSNVCDLVGATYGLHDIRHDLDIQLRQPDSENVAYLLHIPRQPGDEDFTLHQGTNKLDPVIVAVKFEGYFSGTFLHGNPSSALSWTQWEQPLTNSYTAFTVTTKLGDRSYRWNKTEGKRIGRITVSHYPIWALHEVTSSSASQNTPRESKPVAQLSLEPSHGGIKDKLLNRDKDPTYKGDLVVDASLDPAVRDVAIALVMALWHRDRQILDKQKLAPCLELKPSKNARYNAGMGGVGVLGGLGLGFITAGAGGLGGYGGGGGDCGGGGGGGGGC